MCVHFRSTLLRYYISISEYPRLFVHVTIAANIDQPWQPDFWGQRPTSWWTSRCFQANSWFFFLFWGGPEVEVGGGSFNKEISASFFFLMKQFDAIDLIWYDSLDGTTQWKNMMHLVEAPSSNPSILEDWVVQSKSGSWRHGYQAIGLVVRSVDRIIFQISRCFLKTACGLLLHLLGEFHRYQTPI